MHLQYQTPADLEPYAIIERLKHEPPHYKVHLFGRINIQRETKRNVFLEMGEYKTVGQLPAAQVNKSVIITLYYTGCLPIVSLTTQGFFGGVACTSYTL